MICPYCHKERQYTHGCPGLNKALEDIQKVIQGIDATMERPGSRELTSNQMKNRSDYRRQIATTIKLNGGQVNDEHK